MQRKIIKIDETKCNGCGLCAEACHEGAIGMVADKATLLRDDYCDGLGDCLPVCPTGAITFEEREAAAYDEKAVKAKMADRTSAATAVPADSDVPSPCSCPGTASRAIVRDESLTQPVLSDAGQSQLSQWPVQIKLAPVNAPYFEGANLLIAADCTAYAYANFHQDFIKNRITLIGCPKLDSGDYAEKLTDIFSQNNIKSLTVVRMEVPCCGGLENAAKQALQNSGKFIPWQVVTLTTDGAILDI